MCNGAALMLLVQGHALRSKGLVHTALLTGEETFLKGRVTFPRHLTRLEGVSQVNLPVSYHLASFLIQAQSSLGKYFLNVHHLEPY